MRILGLSSFGHDTSAALLEDGVIRAVIEESKLSRQKNARGLPAKKSDESFDARGVPDHADERQTRDTAISSQAGE